MECVRVCVCVSEWSEWSAGVLGQGCQLSQLMLQANVPRMAKLSACAQAMDHAMYASAIPFQTSKRRGGEGETSCNLHGSVRWAGEEALWLLASTVTCGCQWGLGACVPASAHLVKQSRRAYARR